jgi:hypothetical protein
MRFSGARIALIVIAAALSACSGSSGDKSGIQILGSGDSSTGTKPQPIRTLGAEEIRTVLIGKTFQYTRKESSGFVTYNEDGSLTYQDDTKGEGQGTWSAVEGQLCQSIAGQKTECGEFKSTGDAYQAGTVRLASVG